ncbi:hypothetical protein [Ectobacillus panaciterrae]|uniref:hypothetical protein n=1 Tax=Ectobacillus panaciterrae TaxID=363872 RepID=UPI0012DEB093|nr:hypothetical protein [Ectobacillus panaciterrae]
MKDNHDILDVHRHRRDDTMEKETFLRLIEQMNANLDELEERLNEVLNRDEKDNEGRNG